MDNFYLALGALKVSLPPDFFFPCSFCFNIPYQQQNEVAGFSFYISVFMAFWTLFFILERIININDY